MAPTDIVIAREACAATAQLLPRFETALRAAARLLHDLVGVDDAEQLGDAFDARARGSLALSLRLGPLYPVRESDWCTEVRSPLHRDKWSNSRCGFSMRLCPDNAAHEGRTLSDSVRPLPRQIPPVIVFPAVSLGARTPLAHGFETYGRTRSGHRRR
jgi:hypothetical protein